MLALRCANEFASEDARQSVNPNEPITQRREGHSVSGDAACRNAP